MKLDAELIESFALGFLFDGYENPVATPNFHREGWKLYCSETEQAMIIAPRGHAKSSAFTHCYVLCNILFKCERHIVLYSATERMAKEHLNDIAKELRSNENIRTAFQVQGFSVDTKTEIVVRFSDGWETRVVAKGVGQRIRGVKWQGHRIGLLVCDDLETDEQVSSKDKRDQFVKWFYGTLRPALKVGGKIRIHGTILHVDSLLSRLRNAKSWKHLFYSAHTSFDDFSTILWPDAFNEERLRSIRQNFIDTGYPSGYSQEYLCNPLDSENAYLHEADFIPMEEKDYDSLKIIGVGVDFAISKAQYADKTAIIIGGKDSNNLLHVLDVRCGRWDTFEIIDQLLAVQQRWNPSIVWVEGGVLWRAISSVIYREMQRKGIFLNLQVRNPVVDKASRGRSLQRRMRAKAVRYDVSAYWYPSLKEELLHFTGQGESISDDQFDALALLSLGFDSFADLEIDDFSESEEEENTDWFDDRCPITGY